jgi:hypothetical protein
MTDPTVTAVSDERLTGHELRELHAELGAIPFYSTLSMPHRARIAVAELLRARSALADVGECELCKGARFLPYFNGEVNPRCHVCKGTGKQPRPAAATLATTGHLLMPSLVSPAAHTAQDEREALLAGAALAMQRVLVVQPDAWDEVAHWKNVAATLRRLASTAERE